MLFGPRGFIFFFCCSTLCGHLEKCCAAIRLVWHSVKVQLKSRWSQLLYYHRHDYYFRSTVDQRMYDLSLSIPSGLVEPAANLQTLSICDWEELPHTAEGALRQQSVSKLRPVSAAEEGGRDTELNAGLCRGHGGVAHCTGYNTDCENNTQNMKMLSFQSDCSHAGQITLFVCLFVFLLHSPLFYSLRLCQRRPVSGGGGRRPTTAWGGDSRSRDRSWREWWRRLGAAWRRRGKLRSCWKSTA